jgi:C1A family cysteine protease
MEMREDVSAIDVSQFGLGRTPDAPDRRDYAARRFVQPSASAGLKRIDWSNRLGPVLNQGSTPQCVTHAAAVIKTWQERRDHRRTYQFNPAVAYRKCKQIDADSQDGTTARTVCSLMSKEGYGRLNMDWNATAPQFKINGYRRIRGISELENALAQLGPCLLGVTWYNEWFHPDKAVVRNLLVTPTDPQRSEAGGHEIVIRGFDRTLTRFNVPVIKIRNSWGADWGKDGCAWISYDELERQLTLPEYQRADIWSVIDQTT